MADKVEETKKLNTLVEKLRKDQEQLNKGIAATKSINEPIRRITR